MTPVQPRSGSLVQPVSTGILAALVGFSSSFALLLQAFSAAGASRDEASSALCAILLSNGVLGALVAWRSRMPITIAWSTAGAALLLATGMRPGGYAAAIGAYLATAALVIVAGLWRPFGRAVASIPISLAAAMLAGVLLDLCLAPVRAVAAAPALALPIVLAWAVAWRFARAYAVPIAVAVAVATIVLATPLPSLGWEEIVPRLVLVPPVFTLDALISISVPLFIVTMASQNVPGLAVLNSNGYRPAIGPLFVATGVASAISAPFGAHSTNLAAITAALCAGPDAHPDPARRWVAALASGLGYVALAGAAGFAAAFVAASPPLLIQSVAGLALLGSLAGALVSALSREDERVPAIVTFVTTASGISVAGVGAAFWGLVAGGAMLALARAGRARPV